MSERQMDARADRDVDAADDDRTEGEQDDDGQAGNARMDDADTVLDDDDILSDVDEPDGIDVDGTQPLPEQLTGRASGTDEDLVALFGNATDKHMADGFRGGSEDEPPVDDEDFDEHPS